MSECIEWAGSLSPEGYGRVRGGKYAHRVAYEESVGVIPEGMQIDHLCRNRACVNPSHLEAVTQQENLRRGMGASAVNARKTECKWGHPLDYVRPDGKGRGCTTCRRARNRLKVVG